MLTEQLIFYAFSALLLFAGLGVILSRNSVKSALFLVLAFFAGAGIWILSDAEFLGLVLILVYVGAVMTLFLFVIMTLNLDTEKLKEGFVKYLPYGLVVLLMLVGLMIYATHPQHLPLTQNSVTTAIPTPSSLSNTEAIGMVLYTDYAYPFEIAGTILLVAIIAAIALSFRGHRNRKVVLVDKQLQARASDRVKLIDLPSEKKS